MVSDPLFSIYPELFSGVGVSLIGAVGLQAERVRTISMTKKIEKFLILAIIFEI
jgi:hypothetical protein